MFFSARWTPGPTSSSRWCKSWWRVLSWISRKYERSQTLPVACWSLGSRIACLGHLTVLVLEPRKTHRFRHYFRGFKVAGACTDAFGICSTVDHPPSGMRHSELSLLYLKDKELEFPPLGVFLVHLNIAAGSLMSEQPSESFSAPGIWRGA